RWVARTLHIAPGQVGNRRTENDRTRTIRLGEIPSTAGYGIDRDLLSGRRAGRSGADRKISAANREIEGVPAGDSLRSSAGSRCRRRKQEKHRSQAEYFL